MSPCPSIRELLDGVKALTRQKEGTFQTAWAESFIDPYHCCERGGFIYVEFPVPSKITQAWIVLAPKGATMNQRTVGPNATIDLNKPGTQQKDAILVANFHTHPLSVDVGGDPQPSRADMDNAYFRQVPGIVISRNGVYAYGPERREILANPKGYPGGGEAPPFPRPTLVRAAGLTPTSPPWVVKNQWPEGVGPGAAPFSVVGDDANEDNTDVIYVEWSGEDVEHGEPLDEK